MAQWQSNRSPPRPVSLAGLWFGILAGPVAWALHAIGSYFLAPIACRMETAMPLYTLTAAAVLVAVVAGVHSGINSQRIRAGTRGDTGQRGERTGFMAMAGMFMSVMFLAIILVQAIPIFFLDAC